MNHYLITALPRLPELGGTPPLHPAALLDHVKDSPRAQEAVSLLFLGHDLRQRDGFLSGELRAPEPLVLTQAQVRGEAPLPEGVAAAVADDASPGAAMDAVWGAYFRHVAARAEALPSPFLAGWVRHEVALRNALARVRAQGLGLDVARSAVATDLSPGDPELAALASQWAAVANQLAALRLLDAARLGWIGANEPYFSFDDDELVAYAARLLLVHRWHRLGPPPDAARPQPSMTQGAPS